MCQFCFISTTNVHLVNPGKCFVVDHFLQTCMLQELLSQKFRSCVYFFDCIIRFIAIIEVILNFTFLKFYILTFRMPYKILKYYLEMWSLFGCWYLSKEKIVFTSGYRESIVVLYIGKIQYYGLLLFQPRMIAPPLLVLKERTLRHFYCCKSKCWERCLV